MRDVKLYVEGRPVTELGFIRAVQLAVFLDLDAEGYSASRIARELGVTQRTVVRWRAAAGIAGSRPEFVSDLTLELASDMLEGGATFIEVERRLGIGMETVRRHYPGRYPTLSRTEAGKRGAYAPRQATAACQYLGCRERTPRANMHLCGNHAQAFHYCAMCKRVKPNSQFYGRKRRSGYCRDCTALYYQEKASNMHQTIIDRMVAAAPPLSEAQRTRIAALLAVGSIR